LAKGVVFRRFGRQAFDEVHKPAQSNCNLSKNEQKIAPKNDQKDSASG
jgi:hypothetical protein